jgi:hypothetical protein
MRPSAARTLLLGKARKKRDAAPLRPVAAKLPCSFLYHMRKICEKSQIGEILRNCYSFSYSSVICEGSFCLNLLNLANIF